MTEFSPGTIVDGRFQVLTEVGQGGMGIVYRARHTTMDMDVALKVLKTGLCLEEDKVNRFRREARVVSLLDHPNIVQIYAVGVSQQGQPYIAMEFLTGRQLSDFIQHQGALPWRDAIPYMVQLCDALTYAHGKDIVHRDIKPSNIVITGDNKIKLVDFGIAKSLSDASPSLTRTEMVLGSVFYLSPGQFQGRAANARSDIYSLGCTFFEMLAGEPPFHGDTIFDTVNKQANEPLPKVNKVNPKSEIPADLQKLLEYMTEKESENRPASAAEVSDLLRRIADGKQVSIAAASKTSQPHLKINNTVRLIVLVALLANVAFVVLAFSKKPQRATAPNNKVALLTTDPEEGKLVNQIMAKKEHTTSLAIQYSDLSNVYALHDQPAAAIITGIQALHLSEENHADAYSAGILMNLGHRYADLGYLDLASQIYNRLIERYNSDSAAVREAQAGYLRTREEDEDYFKADQMYVRLEPYLKSMSEPDVMVALQSEARTCLRLGRFEDVLQYAKQWRALYGSKRGFTAIDLQALVARVALHENISGERIKEIASATRAEIDYGGLPAELLVRSGYVDDGIKYAGQLPSLYAELVKDDDKPSSMKIHTGKKLRNDLVALSGLLPRGRALVIESAINEIDRTIDNYQSTLVAPAQCVVPVPLPDEGKIRIESPVDRNTLRMY